MSTPNQPIKSSTTQTTKPVAQTIKEEPVKPEVNENATIITEDNNVESKLKELKDKGMSKNVSEEDLKKDTLQNEKEQGESKPSFEDEIAKLAKDANEGAKDMLSEKIKSEVTKIPTSGRIVTFFFAKDDGICTNNMTPSLPAMVVDTKDLTTSLSVYTLDTRDPIVLRKDIPHKSIAPKDSEGDIVKPFWDWPIISK